MRSFGDVFDLYVRRNLVASRRVFERAAETGVRVVFASSSSVYGDAERYPTREDAEPRPLNPYGITKAGCEQLAYAYAKNFGLDAVVLRYFTFYGPRQRPDMAFARIVDALARGSSFELYGDGLQSRSFTYVLDGVDATIAAMESPPGAVYNVGGGREVSMRDVIATLEEISGSSLDVVERPAAAGDTRRTAPDVTAIERGSDGVRQRRSRMACALSGIGRRVESPRGERGSRRRARSRSRPLLERDRRALVAAGARPTRRRRHRLPRLARWRTDLACGLDRLSGRVVQHHRRHASARAAGELVDSRDDRPLGGRFERAATKARMSAKDLRGKISTKTISTGLGTGAARPAVSPLVRVRVESSTRRRARLAANDLAATVVQRLSPFANAKIAGLKERVDGDQQQIDAIRRASASATATDRALLALQLGDILDDQLQAKQLLIQAEQIEKPKVLTFARGVKATARSRRNSVVVAAFIGLLVGLAAALAWEPLARRRS